MQTVNGVETEQYLDTENQPVPESAVQTNDSEAEEPAINVLLAAAEEFNAAFNTALYALEISRKLAKERSARIDELDASLLSINGALQEATREATRKDEIHADESEALNRTIRELESERERLRQQIVEQQQSLDTQSGKMRAEAETHARVCAEFNDRIASLSSDHESLLSIHNNLIAHAKKLENLNRALHESTISENEVHKKILEEKDAAIVALQARLELMDKAQGPSTIDANAEGEMRAALHNLETRLKESESRARMLAERAGIADELEARVEQLSRELQATREGEDSEVLAPGNDLQDRVVDLEAASVTSTSGQRAGQPETSQQAITCEIPPQRQPTGPAPVNTDRIRLITHLDGLLEEQGGAGARQAVMYVSVDNFIRLRDEIGVVKSDQIDDEIYGIVISQCDGNDVLARFGDCTLAVLCSGTGREDAQKKAEKIRSTVENHTFETAGRAPVIQTSIGICSIRDSDSSAEQVLSRAKLVCETARLTGGNQVAVNSAIADNLSMPGSNTSHTEIVDRALAEDRIKIRFQPMPGLKDNSVNCFEVLTRVVDENGEIILPGEFFSMAVNSGKSRELDLHVIENAMRMLAENTNPNIKVFIKLGRQTVSYHDLPLWIMGKGKQYRINSGRLVFELVERELESELKNISMLSRALNKIGCKIAIVHYRLETQMQHLSQIHVDYLKIDSELVQNLSDDVNYRSRITEIVGVARTNNLTTIADGVESSHCHAMLRELGVNLAQGYYISGPAGNMIFESHGGEAGDAVANHSKASFPLG